MKVKTILRIVVAAIASLFILPPQVNAQLKTYRIAFNVPDMTSPKVAYALALLQKEAEVLGVTIFPQDGKGSVGQQAGDLMNSINMGLDGVILIPNDEHALSPSVDNVLSAHLPIVTIGQRLREAEKNLSQLSSAEPQVGLIEQGQIALKALVSYLRDGKPLPAAGND